ncbi:MAG: histidine phosphatase family protein [Acholeplasmataceae bacterium]|jgi:broad specificity phosphatase PhoE|nr:histidine phosphatase family protein [Acholeplasmataceae bacterium]
MAFYLIRHGETAFNLNKKMQGWLDIELNELGQLQAEGLANYLVDFHFDDAYSSDLKRAYQTAEAYSRISHQHIKKDEMLREIRLGSWEGKTWKEVKEEYEDFFSNKGLNHVEEKVHGGESLKEFRDRVVSHFMELARKHKDDDIIIFTHGGNIRMILLEILNIPLEKREMIYIENASITVIAWNDDKSKLNIVKQNEIPYSIGDPHGNLT